MQEGARKQGGRGTDMEGKGHDPRVWPYGRDVNATKKSRLGRYEHRFLIRGPIQVSDGPVDGVPGAAYSHHQVHRRQDYGGGPDQGGTPPWDYRTRTPHSPPHRYIITSSAQDNRLHVHRQRCREQQPI